MPKPIPFPAPKDDGSLEISIGGQTFRITPEITEVQRNPAPVVEMPKAPPRKRVDPRNRMGVVAVLLLLGLVWLTRASVRRDIAPLPPAPIHEAVPDVQVLIAREATLRGIPPQLALDRAWQESRFRVDAVAYERNCTRSYGPMQLNSRWFPHAASMSIEENIEAGVGLLALRFRQCRGDWRCTHWAYKSGQVRR